MIMGWTLHDLEDGWKLATRGGFEGVYITDAAHKVEIEIPEALLLGLAAYQIASNKIRELEQDEPEDLLLEARLVLGKSDLERRVDFLEQIEDDRATGDSFKKDKS